MSKQTSANRMGTVPVPKLMLSMGIPMIFSMMLQALYNIVDSAFVSNMPGEGETALNALTLAFPVQVLLVAIGIGTGVGVNALLSKSLGQGNRKKVNQVAGNALFLGTVIFLVFFLFGLFGVKFYIASQTSNPTILKMGTTYLRICCLISFGIVYFSMFEKMLQATGLAIYSTIAQIGGAVTNMILDPILIYGWFGLPAMGVAGAAYATVIGQIVSFLLAMFFHLKYNKEITTSLQDFRPAIGLIQEIYAIGLPAILAQALMSVMTYGLNLIFVQINENVVTAYGLYYKIQQFILFAAFGLRDAITPIVSFNHGMGSKSRVNAGIRYGMLYTLTIMLFGTVLLEVLAVPFAHIFGLSGQTEQLCIDAMHIVSLSFVFAGANVAFQGIFQALDSGKESLILSVCRQFLFVLPVAWGFSRLAISHSGMTWMIWSTFFFAELLTVLIGIFFMKKINDDKIQVLETVHNKIA